MLICLLAGNAAGQQIDSYNESQARLIEPKQDVFVVPLVADIQVLDNQTRQDYGPYKYDLKTLVASTFEEAINNIKARALYTAAREADADLIVAATFNVKSDDKVKNLMIVNVSGYPGKYINFRPLNLEKAEDYDWIRVVYPATYRTQDEKEKAVRK